MKNKTIFVCQSCGYESSKWLGKCPSCNSWNSFAEERQQPTVKYSVQRSQASKPVKLIDVTVQDEPRIPTGMQELDRVLGGGIVKGSLVLVGGDPGIGKSTLLLQICGDLGKNNKILYVSGEESQNQVKLRAQRLGIHTPGLSILSETDVENIRETVLLEQPDIVIVDSIQTMFKSDISSAPGSVSQVREATLLFMNLAKENGISIFIVGHVTKEGTIAGPRVLEHMVDCVLYFEGERHHSYRMLRAVKNRFGSTNEMGVFEMRDVGLVEVPNPSLLFLEGRPDHAPGSAVLCTMEGTRPVLAEIQALVSPTSFGIPRRMATGIDYNRVVLLMAVLEKRVGLHMGNYDAYVNVVGGIRVTETAADLGVILAIASSFKNKVMDPKTVVAGEVGLTGEVRSVNFIEKRIMEAKKLGFDKIIIPQANLKNLQAPKGIEVIAVSNVSQAISRIFV